MPTMTANDKAVVLWHGVKALHAQDPEHVENGCWDLSKSLLALARHYRMKGVQMQTGYAVVGKRKVPHAWMVIDGEVFDALWEFLDINRDKKVTYVVDPRVEDMLKDDFRDKWQEDVEVEQMREEVEQNLPHMKRRK